MGPGGVIIGRISVKVLPDTSEFASQARASLRRIERRLEATVSLALDDDSKRKVEKALEELKEDLKPSVKPDISQPHSMAAQASLILLARDRIVNLIPVVRQEALAGVMKSLAALSGTRVVQRFGEEVWDVLKRLDKLAPAIGAVSLAITGLLGWLLAGVSNLVAFGASLASIASIALTLPGTIVGFALGLTTTIVALKDFGSIFPDVVAGLRGLGDAMSAAFWGKAQEPFRRMIDTLFPQFQDGLKQTATQVGAWFGAFADSSRGILDGAIAGMFADLAESIDIASGATDSLVSIIKILGEIGASYLPRLAEWFVNIADRFDAWLSAAAEDGRLQQWIETGITNLGALFDIAVALGSTLAGIANAAQAAGGSTLPMAAETMQRIADAVNSPGFQEGLTTVFRAAHEAMSIIAERSGPQVKNFFSTLSELLGTVLPVAGAALGTALGAVAEALSSPAFTDGVLAFFEGLLAGVEALAPAMPPLATALGALGDALGIFLAVLGPTLAVLIEALVPPFNQVVLAVHPLIEVLGGALQGVIVRLAPVLTALADVITSVLQAVEPLLPPLLDLGMVILEHLVGVLMVFIEALLPPLVALIDVVVIVLEPILNLFTWLAETLSENFNPTLEALLVIGEVLLAFFEELGAGIEAVIEWVEGAWNNITDFFEGGWKETWEGIKEFFSGIWDSITGAVETAIDAIKGYIEVPLETISNIISTVTEGWQTAFDTTMGAITGVVDTSVGKVKGFINGLAEIPDKVRKWFADAKNGVTEKLDEAVDTVKEIPTRVLNALGDLGSLLLEQGKKLISGLINGIKGSFDDVKSTLSDLTGKIFSWKGPPERDRVLLTETGQLIIDGLIAGLESRYGDVRRSLESLTEDIASMQIAAPQVGDIDSSLASIDDFVAEGREIKVLNYYAAPGSSIDAEEDLFKALTRGRGLGW